MTRADHRKHRRRSRRAVGAAVVATLAVVAVCTFVLTRTTGNKPAADGLRMGSGTDNGAAAPPGPTANATGTKGDRQPPISATAPKSTVQPEVKPSVKPSASPSVKAQPTTPPAVDTGPESPRFKHGEWIAVLDKYPGNAGDTAKDTAAKITRAGIAAKAMLVNGQYPGFTDSSLARVTDTWVIYLGPGTSSEQMFKLCRDPRTQAVYPSSACPTYEPAG